MLRNKLKNLLQLHNLTFYICLVSVAVMSLYVYYIPPFMILWGGFWLWENNFKLSKSLFVRNKVAVLFFLFIGFYLWQILGLLFSDSIGTGFERIFKRLSFLVFPLVLFYPGEKIIKNINLIIRLFAVCTFIYVIYSFGNALHNSISITDGKWIFNSHPADYSYENYFFSSRISSFVHPSYLSMYIILSLLIALESGFDNSLKQIHRFLFFIMILVFLLMIYLLSSRAGIISCVIVVPLYLFFKLSQRFPKWIIYLPLFLFTAILIKIAWSNNRLNYNPDGVTRSQPDEVLKNDVRYYIWNSAIEVIKRNIVFGVGTGDATEELKKEFKNRGYVNGYYDNLNAHNQYLEILLENGIIGLTLFLGIFGFMIYIALSERNLIYALFILMIMIFFIFESSLNRLAGVTFFPLFSFLLLYIKHPERIKLN